MRIAPPPESVTVLSLMRILGLCHSSPTQCSDSPGASASPATRIGPKSAQRAGTSAANSSRSGIIAVDLPGAQGAPETLHGKYVSTVSGPGADGRWPMLSPEA
eukprot:4779074-Prymnesium_polylepis.1